MKDFLTAALSQVLIGTTVALLAGSKLRCLHDRFFVEFFGAKKEVRNLPVCREGCGLFGWVLPVSLAVGLKSAPKVGFAGAFGKTAWKNRRKSLFRCPKRKLGY